jgi:hypothetical protein
MYLINLTKLDEGENHLPAPPVVCHRSVEDPIPIHTHINICVYIIHILAW